MATIKGFDIRKARTLIVDAVIASKRRYGGKRIAMIDGDERELNYNDILKATFALSGPLAKGLDKGEFVGVLLPTGVGAVIAMLAISASGRVPAMLNFTAGARNLKSACRTGKIRRIITARKFIEVGGYHELINELKTVAEIVELETVRQNLSLVDKARAAIGLVMPALVRAGGDPDRPGVLLFTSGTEGDPKGVVLTHTNVVANVHQVLAHVPELYPTDILFNPLPTFHCFGLTAGALLPLVGGMKCVLHPSPLQTREIVKRVKDTGATLLFATDTFVSQYARAAKGDELSSLRFAVCGAERVRDETRGLLRKRFGTELIEGYGATEASPVVAVNSPSDNRAGSVGRFMPGIEHRLETVEGVKNGGRLFIRGPNVMAGYLLSDQPGVIQPLPGGWHDTGDIVSVDDEGFVRIRGRVKRFAKIGGEMVSLAVVENCASSIWPDHLHVALSIPDPRKGEQIILLSETPEANRSEMIAFAQNHGVSDLTIPRQVYHVEAVPVLGTGKLDYGSAQRMADEIIAKTRGAAPEEEAAPVQV
jgi:acyl-[acyl-carrier-protein]-phospholipid O-acyltransferase / long-chain-fatty-acid--[acyl-carrier-protein] ligase